MWDGALWPKTWESGSRASDRLLEPTALQPPTIRHELLAERRPDAVGQGSAPWTRDAGLVRSPPSAPSWRFVSASRRMNLETSHVSGRRRTLSSFSPHQANSSTPGRLGYRTAWRQSRLSPGLSSAILRSD